MIIALIFWLTSLSGGDSVHPFSLPIEQAIEQVKAHVSDSDRKAKAVEILTRMKATEKEWMKAREPEMERLQDLLNDRTSPPADISKALTEINNKMEAMQAQLLKLRFELKTRMLQEEWAAVFADSAATK